MKKDYKLLVIGDIYSVYMTAFVKYLKKENLESKIDFISLKQSDRPIAQDVLDNLERICLVPFKSKNRIVQIWKTLFHHASCFKKFVKGKHYDVVNIQMPKYHDIAILHKLQKITDNIVITPWGSDFLQVGKIKKAMIRPLYRRTQYVTCTKGLSFTNTLKKVYPINDENIVEIQLGAEPIDYLATHKKEIDSVEAKRRLGLQNKYIITCAHNSRPTQQHLKIIEAIQAVRDQLPNNLILLFPMTTCFDKAYTANIKDTVAAYNLPAVFYEKFLDNEQLFLIRQATDMFIHIQTTDAHSASVMEHILLDKKIINGTWLSYPDLETFSTMPYYKVDTVEDLPAKIVQVYNAPQQVNDPALIEYICSWGWKYQIKKWNEFFMSIAD